MERLTSSVYSEALRQKLLAKEFLLSDFGAEWSDRVYTPWISAFLRDSLDLFPFFWSEPLCRLVEAAQETLPDLEYSDALVRQLPSPSPIPGGFFWFEKPVVAPTLLDLPCIRGFSFVRWGRDQDESTPLIRFSPWVEVRDLQIAEPHNVPNLPIPFGAFTWRQGRTLAESLHLSPSVPEPGLEVECERRDHTIARFFAACLVLLNQQLVRSEPAPAERALRRRAQRAGTRSVPPIHVVHLREFERSNRKPTGTGESEASGREYAVQWVVSGHWRQQYYPSLQRHQLRWIAPYRKGPVDKPLKVGRPTVYAVTR